MASRDLVTRDARSLALDAGPIDYVLVRRRGRRGVGLKVDETGLTVSAPAAMPRWGSCNSRREVRLAWRLVKAPLHLVDYVICHELAHLRHMNHSAAFWNEVERQCPDYKRLRAELFATDHLYRSF